jgi:hypothetical protein
MTYPESGRTGRHGQPARRQGEQGDMAARTIWQSRFDKEQV